MTSQKMSYIMSTDRTDKDLSNNKAVVMMLEKIVKLGDYRKKANITQKAMAERLQLSERQYRRLEKGDCSPDIWQACELAQILNTPINNIWFVKPV